MKKRILVALDETEASEKAAQFVNEFFDPDRTEILGLNVASMPVPWIPAMSYGGVWAWPYAGYAAYGVYPSSALDEEAERQDQSAVSTVMESGLREAEVVIEHGDVPTAIQRAAEEHRSDLIVVGTRDQGALKRMLFGSVSDDLVHHAERPVLIVR